MLPQSVEDTGHPKAPVGFVCPPCWSLGGFYSLGLLMVALQCLNAQLGVSPSNPKSLLSDPGASQAVSSSRICCPLRIPITHMHGHSLGVGMGMARIEGSSYRRRPQQSGLKLKVVVWSTQGALILLESRAKLRVALQASTTFQTKVDGAKARCTLGSWLTLGLLMSAGLWETR